MSFNRLMFSIALGVLVLAHGNFAHADVYRCQGANGKLEYSDTPCTSGRATGFMATPAAPAPAASRGAYGQQLDRMVAAALQAGDVKRARELATTDTHAAMIRDFEQRQAEAKRAEQARLMGMSQSQDAFMAEGRALQRQGQVQMQIRQLQNR